MTTLQRKSGISEFDGSLMENTWFRLMAAEFKIRDFLRPRRDVVKEAELKRGFDVLDFGCGPGGYVPAVSKAIGTSGELYALDVMPLAIDMVKKTVARNDLKNVETVQSDCATGLLDGQLDVALLYDVFHGLENQEAVLRELHRVLKPGGLLSFSDHHLKEEEIISKMTGAGLFTFEKKGKYTYSFRR